MDTNIRLILSRVDQLDVPEGEKSLHTAYDLLRHAAETKPSVDVPDAFGQDLHVLCAERALQFEKTDMARECLKMYFMRNQPANQFLCRAYLCQAQLLAPNTAENPEQLEKAVVYLIKAINLGKENTRYHFLVYNASLLYWQFSRPFLKSGYRQYLAQSLHQVVKALDDIDDKDYEWRAQLMIALIECHVDAGRKSDAAHIALAAVTFIKQNVPTLHKTVFGLMVRHQLVESVKFQKDLRSSVELNYYYRICKLKLAVEQKDPEKDLAEEIRRLLAKMCGKDEKPAPSLVKEKSLGRKSLVPEDRRSPSRQSRRTPSPIGKKLPDCSPDRPYLLLELARLALDYNITDVAQQCIDQIQDCKHMVTDPGYYLEVEFLQCEMMVKCLKDRQESYQKAVIETRLQAINRCDEVIQNAMRMGNPNVIQAGCVTQWNLCLPLLQPNLRHHLRKPLTLLTEALESIYSLLVSLRCQAHMELAKCEEDQDQIQVAMEHLRKTLGLDDSHVYQEIVEAALHRLELRAELYEQPERAEDQAAMIIEQARKADSGSIMMKRSLLMKVGHALAPDTFLLVLEGESDTKDVVAGAGPQILIKKLAGKARQFRKCAKKVEGHLRRLEGENDKERARLWGDLAKTARKQQVWDVCRTAARFCLLYDDGRWKYQPPHKDSPTPRAARGKSVERETKEASDGGETERTLSDVSREKTSVSRTSRESGTHSIPDPGPQLFQKDLIRMMAEVNFIHAEAFIHLLRSEGVELGDTPIPPQDKRKRPKGYVVKKPEDDPEWIEYCDWISWLSEESTGCFLRAVTLGTELQESWIICSAGAYVWNYCNHILSQTRHCEIVNTLQIIIEALKKVGYAGETTLLVNICNALATGLIQPWLPKSEVVQTDLVPDTGRKGSGKGSRTNSPSGKSPKRGKSQQVAGGKVKASPSVSISPDAGPDLKRALEVCEYALKETNGYHQGHMVPIAVRHPLLQTWVKVKQMLLSQINKALGVDDEENVEGQNAMTRAMVAVEMLTVQHNGILEFKETPTLAKAIDMMQVKEWSDKLIELQLWTRLAYLGFQAKNFTIVSKSASMALAFADVGTLGRGKKQDSHKYIVEREMLCYASALYGQSMLEHTQGKSSVRRMAMGQFIDSARFAREASNGDLVMTAARLYWNACLPLIGQPIEREVLKEPLTVLLQCITDTTDKKKYKKQEEEEEEDADETPRDQPLSEQRLPPANPEAEANKQVQEKSGGGIIGGPDDDLTLRACLYGVLFQSYADQGQWEAGLRAMDQAINDMPRTNHRLLIFKHLVIVKAKLGLNVDIGIQKFKDESEDYVAHMWRRVALCSTQQLEQLQAYQNAIEALTLPSCDWQKFDYLLELGQWLYCNEFPVEDAIEQLEWAADILLNMKFEVEQKQEDDDDVSDHSSLQLGKTKKGRGRKGKTPPMSAASGKTIKDHKPTKKRSVDSRKGPPAVPDSGRKSAASSIRDSETADKETDITPIEYVPVKKEAVIGVLPNNPALTVEDLTDVRQLEGLFRCHTLLAQMSGRASPHHKDYCLMAFAYVMRIWEVTLGQCGPIIKEIAKTQAAEQAVEKPSPKGKKNVKDEKPVKEKPKRKGALDAIPRTVEDWGSYDVPDEALEAFKHETMRCMGLNTNTIDKPSLTLLYLGDLCEQLRAVGYNQLVLPVLAMAEAIVRQFLNQPPLLHLIHLRSLEVCLELNLLSGVNFHQKLTSYKLSEEDQSRCREEVAVWQEKQAQVAKEEERIRNSVMKFKEEQSKKLPRQQTDLKPKVAEDSTVNHLGKQVGKVELREVWTSAAEVLIRNGVYQMARVLLNEAYQTALAFSDCLVMAKILYLLGKLSYHEAQYGQAVAFCQLAQKTYDGDEMFWYDNTMLMVEATLKDYQLKDKDRSQKARGILLHALSIFREITELRPNKLSICGFILAHLEAKLGSVQAQMTLRNHDDNILKPKVITELVSACKKLKHGADRLIKLGYQREAIPLLREQADILVRLAQDTTELTYKHDYYIQAFWVHQEVVKVSDQVYQDAYALSPRNELKNVSLPVQREAAEVKLQCSDLMLEILQQHVQEERDLQLQEERKGSVLRAVEELIRETPDYSDTQRQWVDTTKILGELILQQLTAVHSLAQTISDLRARALCKMGTCLRLLAVQKGPDPPAQWHVQNLTVQRISEHVLEVTDAASENGQTEGVTEEELYPTSREYIKYSQLISKVKKASDTSHQYLAQATECLTQAVNLSLNKGYTATAAEASLQLVECFGQFDPGLASQYLAVHQSCSASVYLHALLEKALVDPTQSQLAALLHQYSTLLSDNTTTNAARGPLISSIKASLEEQSLAWKKLAISPQHLDLLKEFPPNYTFVLLQHSPDKSHLYGAILDKPKSSGGVGKASQKQAGLQASSKAKVIRVETSPTQLDRLLSSWKWWKHDVMQMLLKMEYQRNVFVQRSKMLANLDSSLKQDAKNPLEEEFEQDEKRLHEQFLELLACLEDYLKPITSQLDVVLRPPSSSSNPRDAGKGEVQQEYIVLLADPHLLQLPLEALRALQVDNIGSLTRDISLQVLQHKLHVETQEDPNDKNKKEKDKLKPPSRIPGLHDASKKQAKIIPLDRPVGPGFLPVDTHAVKYIVDPHLDCAESEEKKPIPVFNGMVEEHSQQFTPRWLGVLGADHTPSPGEYEIYMMESSAFVFYGMERLLSYLPPHKVAALNLPECELVMIYDLAQTTTSFQRQSKVDVLKTHEVLALEKPVEAALLMGLTGVKSIFLNQWHCTLQDNAEKLDLTMKDLLAKGKTTGQAVRLLLDPQKRKDEEAAEVEREAATQQQAAVKSVQGNKTNSARTKAERALAGGDTQRTTSDQDVTETDPVEPEPKLAMTRQWFNMVCYGLPNLILTQIGKV